MKPETLIRDLEIGELMGFIKLCIMDLYTDLNAKLEMEELTHMANKVSWKLFNLKSWHISDIKGMFTRVVEGEFGNLTYKPNVIKFFSWINQMNMIVEKRNATTYQKQEFETIATTNRFLSSSTARAIRYKLASLPTSEWDKYPTPQLAKDLDSGAVRFADKAKSTRFDWLKT